MMPEILKQVGPQQYQFLKSQLSLDKKEAEDDEDVPELIGTFEDAGKKDKKKGKKWALITHSHEWVSKRALLTFYAESLTQSIELSNQFTDRACKLSCRTIHT